MDYPRTKQEFECETARYLARVGDELETQQALMPAFTRRLEDLGFTEVSATCELNGWELAVMRGANQRCRTSRQFKVLIEKLVAGLNRSIDNGFILAVVQGEQLSAAFRLQRAV